MLTSPSRQSHRSVRRDSDQPRPLLCKPRRRAVGYFECHGPDIPPATAVGPLFAPQRLGERRRSCALQYMASGLGLDSHELLVSNAGLTFFDIDKIVVSAWAPVDPYASSGVSPAFPGVSSASLGVSSVSPPPTATHSGTNLPLVLYPLLVMAPSSRDP
jgi:hypothetical protein